VTTFRVPGAEIAYDVAGSGAALALLHAGVADRRMWDDVWDPLAARRRVVRYDLRGYGETYVREAVPYSNRRDLIELLDHLGIERAALVGASRSGTIALDTALEFPDRVAALVLVGGGISGFDGGTTAAEQALFDEDERLEEARDWPALAELEARIWADGVGQPADRVPAVHRRVAEMTQNAYELHGDEPLDDVIPLQPPAVGRLTELRTPTLVIVGDLDTSRTIAAARKITAEVRDARLVELAGVAHMPSMEKPSEFTRIVEEFLDQVGA
jgi:pimeloyl-ACP methyl ester carboxylesterase